MGTIQEESKMKINQNLSISYDLRDDISTIQVPKNITISKIESEIDVAAPTI